MGAVADRQLACDLLDAVTHLGRSLRHRFYDRRWVEPLSGGQGELLAVVDGHPGSTVNRAAASLHLAPNTVSALVSRLVRLGLANEVAIRVLEYRTEYGLSQSAFARLAGMRQPNIARLEAADHEPSLATLRRLAAVLGEHFTVDVSSEGAHLQSAG